ncbi:MAG: ribonuclease P protein component [Bacteroidales bacterium]|nr:ribonuclease P protein component [Bacteroidales bacterium]
MGFLHEHKLALENDFQALLKGGKTYTSFPLRFLYTIEKTEKKSFQLAVSVPKKRFHHAVDRNLMKRRIRESVRHIYNKTEMPDISLKLLIVYCNNTFYSQQKLEEIIEIGINNILDYAKNH